MKVLNKLFIGFIVVNLSIYSVYGKNKELESIVVNKLSRLNHVKIKVLMKKLGRESPKSYFQCLCNSYSTMGNSIRYYPNGVSKGDCKDATDPCLGGNWGCVHYPLPNNPEVIERCIKSAKYDDNSTIVDAITERFDPCWRAIVYKKKAKNLQNKKLKIMADRDSEKISLKKAQKILDEKYKKEENISSVAIYWNELAKKEKARILEVRDECLALRKIALNNAMSTFSSRFSQYMHEFKVRSKEEISKYVEQHRKKNIKYKKQHIDKIKSNNIKIVENQEKIKQYKNKYNNESTQFTTKEKYKSWEKSIKSLKEENKFLKNQNNILRDTVDLIDEKLIQTGKYTNDDIQGILAKNEDAFIGQWNLEIQNRSNTEEFERANREAQNDHARRVAEQLFLGMDRAIIESMNPKKILAELDPILKVEQMEELNATYTKMAEGINDEYIKGIIASRMPETKKYYQQVTNIKNEIIKLNKQIKHIEKIYSKDWDTHIYELKRCIKMTKDGDSPGYKTMQKRWEYRMGKSRNENNQN